jgi:hypothetical protein
MNHRIIFRDTLRLFRESKLLWIFGVLSIVSEVIYRGSAYSIGRHPISCIPYPLVLIAVYVSLLAKAGLVYSTYQTLTKQNSSFSEAWDFCKTKVNGVIGFYFINIALITASVLVGETISLSQINISLAWLIGLLLASFLNAWFTISICTMASNNLQSRPALQTGFLIVLNNIFHLIVLNSILIVFQVLLNFSTGTAVLGIFLIVPFTVVMTLAYREFVTRDSYPALSNLQSTA